MTCAPDQVIALYCRVSTDEQAREGLSLDEQRSRLRAYCHAMGWQMPIREFVDDGFSAKNLKRPAMIEVLKLIESKQISKLLVTKLDRLSRRLLDLLTMIELLERHDVSLVSTSEAFDTDTPSGRLTLQVLGAVAEFERERIRERVVENMTHAAKSGKWLSRAPYGYRLVDKVLVVDEVQARIVKDVYQMFRSGSGYFAIAKRLNRDGIVSPQGKQWSVRTIKLLLTNPAYKGSSVWKRSDDDGNSADSRQKTNLIEVSHAHPVIIEDGLWEEVQAQARTKTSIAPRAAGSSHLLSGMLRCGDCGGTLSIGFSGWSKRERVYRCSTYKNKGVCRSVPYKADLLESFFIDALQELTLLDASSYEVGLQLAIGQASIGDRVRAAKARYARQIEAYAAGLISLPDLTKEKDYLEGLLTKAQGMDAGCGANDRDRMLRLVSRLEAMQIDFRQAMQMLPPQEAKSILKRFISQVIVYGNEHLEIVLQPYQVKNP